MVDSIFSKIYSYRERENNNSKENYFIEIFTYCLKTDKRLLESFLELLKIKFSGEIEAKTQAQYEFGRPDIEINIPDLKTCIIIECKIEHFERKNQLEDYKRILIAKKTPNRHLVFLTKYYEHRVNNNKAIKLTLLKWFDIFKLIDDNNSQLTLQFKTFIKEEGMAESKNFNYIDLTILKNITGTISKMDEVLDGIKEYYEKRIGKQSKDSARTTRLHEERYVTPHYVGQPYRFHISSGFLWDWEEDDNIYIGVQIWLPIGDKFKKTDDYYKLCNKYLRNWEFEEWDNGFQIGKYQLVAQHIIDDDEQVPAMIQFLKECIDNLESLKKYEPRIFR